MKRFFALLLVSTLAFAFSSKAQILKKFTMPSTTFIRIDDGLSSAELTTLTTESTYNPIGTITGTSLPSSDAPDCIGTKYACNLYVLLPAGNTSTNQQILDAIKAAILASPFNGSWPGCGTAFNFSIAGGTNNASAKWFCKNDPE